MYCPFCGERNLTGATTCADCGKALPQALGPVAAVPLPATTLAPQPPPSRTSPALAQMPPPTAAPTNPPSILRSPLAPPLTNQVPSRTTPMPMDFTDDDVTTKSLRPAAGGMEFLEVPRTDPSAVVGDDGDYPTVAETSSLDDAFGQPTRVSSVAALRAALAEAHTQATVAPVPVAVATAHVEPRAPHIEPVTSPPTHAVLSPRLEAPMPTPRIATPAPEARRVPPRAPATVAATSTVDKSELHIPSSRAYVAALGVDGVLQVIVAGCAAVLGTAIVATTASVQGLVDAVEARGFVAIVVPVAMAWAGLVAFHSLPAILGASPGQRLMSTRLMRRSNGDVPTTLRLIARAIGAATTTITLGVGPFFGMLWDPLRRNLGDRFSGVVACRDDRRP
jgi:uncharacterized RDD family membrane protein YckC